MKVLVIGSGGREHAICWKLSKSRLLKKLYAAPGNGGISEIAECVNLKADDIDGILNFVKTNQIDFTVVGPEVPLVAGIVDLFNKNNLKIFGPAKELARLEGSKIYAKKIMKKFGIPTADFKVFDNPDKAKDYLKDKEFPVVIKADGLCAGKGVVIANSLDEAKNAVNDMMVKKIFGKNGENIVIEEALRGEEASILALVDGENFVMLDSSQDHKRIFDNDLGPNTGGMGAYSPAPLVDAELFKKIENDVIKPIIEGFKKENKFYKGILYAGIMVTKEGPKVLEFNVRFGDPETQAILPRLKSDLLDLMLKSAEGKLGRTLLEWDRKASVSVVVASGGYPGDYKVGKRIEGIREASGIKDVLIFHAGTKIQNGNYVTTGGRVLNVTALGETISDAINNSYKAIKLIKFENMHYRTDIGKKALTK